MITIFLILASCLFLIILAKNKSNNARLPPGPRGVPILGNLLQLGTKPHLQFSKWAKQFGNLYMIKLANKPTLILNDATLIRQLLGTMPSTGIPRTELLQMVFDGDFGLANSEGLVWLEQRQFCMKAIKSFGFGRGLCMEPRIISEAEAFMEWIDKERQVNMGKVIINEVLLQSGRNVLWSMISQDKIGTQQESKNVPLLHDMFLATNATVRSGLFFFSWIKYIAPVKSGYVDFTKANKKLREYVETSFESHKKTRINGEPPRDMIDAYIDKVENCTDHQSSFYGNDGWRHSLSSILTLMLAGSDTTGTMVNWTIFYLSVFPTVQEKLQIEIDSIIGQNRVPGLDDKLNMPYAEAVILEVLRMSTLVPFGVIQKLLENIDFHGYQIPEGTLLIPNLYYVHYDKAIWGDPETFRPERFLNSNNGESLKNFVVAFQPGRRTCPGENLGKEVMFLFTIKLLQKFTFAVDPNVNNIHEYLNPNNGLNLSPQKLPLVVHPRT